MSSQTFVEADIWTVAQTDQGNVVLVRPKGSDLAVPIFIGHLETQSILIGMGRVDVPRPLTHDLALSLVRALGAQVQRIEINELREGTFFARIILSASGHELTVDARPSDAIAIALRAACRVFIAESVVEEAGISVNLVAGQAGHGATSGDRPELEELLPADEEVPRRGPGGAKVPGVPAGAGRGLPALASGEGESGLLRAELEDAIAQEDYERAAIIRDRLKELEGGP